MIISSDSVATENEEEGGLDLEVERREFFISPGLHGLRLDVALVSLVPEFSRSYLRQLIDSGAVRMHGVPVAKAAGRVKAGDTGTVELKPTPQSQAFKAESIDFDIIYRDEHLLVINKPVGLVVHPAPGNWSGTLLNGLLAFDPQSMMLPRAGIVHRLDKNTSGLMVVARTRQTMDALVEMIASRNVARKYLALIDRPWVGPRHRDVDIAIGRDPRNRLRMATVNLAHQAGKQAKTSFDVIANCSTAALIRCTLHTGRTHQIRVHLSSIGYPIMADELYGGRLGGGLNRQALHADSLAFDHPVTHKRLEFFAALPPDFNAAMNLVGLSYNEGHSTAD